MIYNNWVLPYIIEDNFLDQTDLLAVLEYCEQFTIKDKNDKFYQPFQTKINWYPNENYIKQSIKSNSIVRLLSSREHPFLSLYEKYFPKIINYYLRLGRNDIIENTKIVQIVCGASSPNFESGIHIDHEFRLGGLLIYLNKEENGGTILQTDKKSIEIPWKQNRSLLLTHEDKTGNRQTYHGWKSTNSWRYTLSFNVCTKINSDWI